MRDRPYFEAEGITIYHARCEAILPYVDPATVSLLLTDPPYGISLDTAYAKRGRGALAGTRDYPQVEGDDKPFDPNPLLRFGRSVLWGANHYADRLPPSSSWLVWDKENRTDAADAELAWSNLGGAVRLFTHMWVGFWRASERGYHVHPTQKPVALMAWILDRWTNPGDLILDPYMGSGPVAQACYEMGRRYIGIECVEAYCEIAVERLQQPTLLRPEANHA